MTTIPSSTPATSAALQGHGPLDAAAEIGGAGVASPSVCDVCHVEPVSVIDDAGGTCSGCAYEQLQQALAAKAGERRPMMCVRCSERPAPWWPSPAAEATEMERATTAYCSGCARVENYGLHQDVQGVLRSVERLLTYHGRVLLADEAAAAREAAHRLADVLERRPYVEEPAP